MEVRTMAPPRIPLADRFWTKVQKTNNCWLWTGATDLNGYGVIHTGNGCKLLKFAHRIAWQLTNCPIPDRLHVLHHCDVPLCCNPKHLFPGTQTDNMFDRDAKGRVRHGK